MVRVEAHLVAMACSQPPEGRAGWTLQLLADRLVGCEIVDSISAETVRQTLKKRGQALAEGALVHPATGQRRVRLRHGGRAGGLPSPVCRQRGVGVPGRDRQNSRACPRPRPGVKETRQPQSARPGAPACYDYEYARNGVSNLFMLFAPLEGWRRVEVDGPAHQGGLGPGGAATGGRGLPGQGPDSPGDGQSEHPSPSVAVRGI